MSADVATRQPEPRGELWDRLLARGWEFDFFQAVWLLERHIDGPARLGDLGPAGDERVRLRPDVNVGFPATDVRRVTRRRREPGAPGDGGFGYCVDASFMGLYGVATPLPLHYAITILRSVDQDDRPQTEPADARETGAEAAGPTVVEEVPNPRRDFLDIFHHRLLSLFYRAWTKYRYERTFGAPGRDVITDYLFWLIGCPRSYGRDVLGVEPLRLLRYAGTLTQHPRSATSLEGILFDYWHDIPVRVESHVGRWVALSPADWNKLGAANSSVGIDLTLGEEVYDLSGAFAVGLGPVDWATYLSFLPDGERFAQTRSLVTLYCADPLGFTIDVTLAAGEAPPTRMSASDDAGRLGYTSWLLTADLPETTVRFEAN